MTFLNYFVLFVLGTIFGSFINVVVFRYNTGMSVVTGRSKCLSCGKMLHWYENIPLFSFLFLRGKCLGCKSKISYQYPLVEFVTGMLFCAIFYVVGFSQNLLFYLLVTVLLVTMSVYDLRHKIIPNSMVFLFDILACIFLVSTHSVSSLFTTSAGLLDLLAGPILFAFFGFFWLVSSGRWMGLGDAKLALGVGWMLGFSGGIFAIIFAFWIGALWSIGILALQHIRMTKSGLTLKSEIPFAPFIILGLYIQIFTSWNFLTIINVLTIR